MRSSKGYTRFIPLLLAIGAGGCEQPPSGLPASPTAPAADGLVPLYSAGTNALPGRFIVVLHDAEVGIASSVAQQAVEAHGGTVHHTYTAALNGFAATLSPAAVDALRRNPTVRYVAQDARVSITQTTQAQGTQTGATWGLDRIDQRGLPLNREYVYGHTGTGVRVYVIDSGIRTAHVEFGGRASVGTDLVNDGENGQDCNGHGTHVAGTIAGRTYGVAKAAQVISVRVLNCGATGNAAQVIAGVDWVTVNGQKPAVANMSLGVVRIAPLNEAIQNSIASGVVYVTAAGNNDGDACANSPASTAEAITVGATTSGDARSAFSNWGACVDLFAPGSGITSAWHTSNTATAQAQGTSMAAPHVAGVAALYLQGHPKASPDAVASYILESSTTGRLTDVKGSPNRLVFASPPAAPPSLAARPATLTSIHLTWVDGGDSEAGFTLSRRSRVPGKAWGAWADLAKPAANTTSFTDMGVEAGTSYEYRLNACNDFGCSPWTITPAVAIPSAPPVRPSGLAARGVPIAQAALTWTDASTNEALFELMRSELSTDGTWTEYAIRANLPADSRSYRDTALAPARTYRYQLRACSVAGCSAPVTSGNVTLPPIPAAPSELTATALSMTAVRVQWKDVSTTETSFTLARALVSSTGLVGVFTDLATLPANGVRYDNARVPPATYQYRIQSCNVAGCSPWAASASVVVPAVPAAPGKVTATVLSATSIRVTWTDAGPFETSYEVRRALRNADGTWAAPTPLTAVPAATRTYSNTGLLSGQAYRYEVRACNTSGCSAFSQSQEVTTR